MTTLLVATQLVEGYAKPTQKLKEEDNTVTFTMVVMTTIFLVGFMLGCWCACRCRHTANPAAARPTPTVAAATTQTDEQDSETELPTSTRPPPTPRQPRTRYSQSIWVIQSGRQYRVNGRCTGLNGSTTASQKFVRCTCIDQVDGDGLRRRAR